MSQHHNLYSQKGCHGCKPCEGGSANIGRITVIVLLACTVIGLLALPFFKKCVYCSHNGFMNKHATPAQQATAAAAAAN